MANARKKGKKKLSFWLTESERELLKEIADNAQINQTDAIRMLLITGYKILKTSKKEITK